MGLSGARSSELVGHGGRQPSGGARLTSTDRSCWISTNDRERLDVTCYDRTCPDDRTSPDATTWKDDRALADPGPVLDYRES